MQAAGKRSERKLREIAQTNAVEARQNADLAQKQKSLADLRTQQITEMVEEEKERANEERRRADEERRRAEREARSAYDANLRVAIAASERGDAQQVLSALDLCAPHLRRWEWSYLRQWAQQVVDYSAITTILRPHPDRELVAVGGRDGRIQLVTSGLESRGTFELGSPVTALRFDERGDRLAGAGENGRVAVWRVGSGEEIASRDDLRFEPVDLLFHAVPVPEESELESGELVLILPPETQPRAWAYADGSGKSGSRSRKRESSSSPSEGDGQEPEFARQDFLDLLADQAPERPSQSARFASYSVSAMDHADASIAVGTSNGQVACERGSQILESPVGHKFAVTDVAVFQTGEVLSRDETGICLLWKPGESPTTLRSFDGAITSVALDQADRLAVGLQDGRCLLVAGDTEHELASQGEFLRSVCFLGATGSVVGGAFGNNLAKWDAAGEAEWSAVGSKSGLYSVSADADAQWLLTGDYDGSVRLWNLATEALEVELAPSDGPGRLSATALSPDGQLAVAGSFGGNLTAWRLPQAGTKR